MTSFPTAFGSFTTNRTSNVFHSPAPVQPTAVPTARPTEPSALNTAAEWVGRGGSALELLSKYRLDELEPLLKSSKAADFLYATEAQGLLKGTEAFGEGLGYGADIASFMTDESKFGASAELGGKYFGKGLTMAVTANPYLSEIMGDLSGKMYRQAVTEDVPALYQAGQGIVNETGNIAGVIGDSWGTSTADRLDYVDHAADVIRDTVADGSLFRQVVGEGMAWGVEGLGTTAALGLGAYEWAGETWDGLWSSNTDVGTGSAWPTETVSGTSDFNDNGFGNFADSSGFGNFEDSSGFGNFEDSSGYEKF